MVKPTLIGNTHPLPEMFVQQYERYLPTAFDESLTLLEKVNKVIGYLYEIGRITNEMLERWNEVYNWILNDGLEEAVKEKLEEWLLDGTLDGILNGNKITLPFVNLKSYIEDNKLTQTKGFQDCLDMATKNGGVHIVIPAGYRVVTTEELVIYKNTTITCGSLSTTIFRDHKGYLIMNGKRDKTYTGYDGNGNITIIGGTWDSNGVKQPSSASAITFAHATNLVFRDMIVKDSNSHSIEINSSKNVVIDNVQCIGFSEDAGNKTAEAIQIDFPSLGGFPAFGEYDGTFCKDITIQNCYFGASGSTGTTAVSRGVGTHSARVGEWHENITIQNCIFDNLMDYGIQCYNYRNVNMLNNTFINCPGGIIIYVMNKDTDKFYTNGSPAAKWQDCDNFLIHGNRFTGTGSKNHIRIYGNEEASVVNVKISNNTIEDAQGTAPCILAINFKNLDISHNTIRGIQRYGVNTENGTGVRIVGNRFQDLKGSAIIMNDNTANITIVGNEILDVDSHGILIDKSSDFTISGNRTIGVNRTNTNNNHIHIVNGSSRGTVTGHIAKNTAYQADYGMYMTNTCTDVLRTGNVWKDAGSVASIYGSVSMVNGTDIQ